MTKKSLSLSLSLLVLIVLLACVGCDGNSNPNPLVGTWVFENGSGSGIEYTFKSNGTFTQINSGSTINGTYTFTDSALTLTPPSSVGIPITTPYEIVTNGGVTTLKLAVQSGIVFVKQ